MQCRKSKLPRARLVALAVAVSLVGLLATASTGFAAVPANGSACQTDGKINGRGATFQTDAQTALIEGYRLDVCGPVTSTDEAGDNMVLYNYSSAQSALTPNGVAGGGVGSGQGIKAAGCRTDAFGGTDTPYSDANMNEMTGPATSVAACPGQTGGPTGLTPPYGPAGPWPNANNTQAAVMSFPVAGSAVGIGAKLLADANCPNPPTSLKFSKTTLTTIWSGDVATWNDSRLVADNPGNGPAGLADCNKTLTRVVRLDNSGTTGNLMRWLQNVDNTRASASGASGCDGATRTNTTPGSGTSWQALRGNSSNTFWPGAWQSPSTGTCSPVVTGTGGADGLLNKLQATDGGIGYADYSDWRNRTGLIEGTVEGNPYTGTYYGDNPTQTCNFAAGTLPGSGSSGAVGLGANGLNWSSSRTGTLLKSDFTNKSGSYPICALTFDLVYTGVSDTNPLVNDPVSLLTNDQRRTLYSYFTYVLSTTAQSRLPNKNYAPIPTGWRDTLRQGFQGNF